MLRAVALLGVATLACLFVVNAGPSQEKGKIKGQLPPGWGALNLTQSQKEKIYQVNAEYKAKIDEMNRKIDELKSAQQKARIAVLSDEQRQQLTKLIVGDEPKTKKVEPKKEPK